MRIGWKECSIGEVCKSVFAGGDVPKSSFSREKTDKYSVPIFSNGLENNGLYGYTDVPRVVEPCITISGRGTIGQPFLREEPFFPIIRLITAIPKDEIDLRFFYYAVSCIDFKSTGVAIPQLTVPAVKAYTIRFPHDINMQKHIVAEFDCLTGIIEKKKQQLEELDNLAQSIFYDMFGDPITNEKGWEVKEISSLFDVGSSKRVFEAQWRDKGVPFYRAREIVRLAKGEPIEDPIFVEEALYKEYSVKYGVPRPNDMMITGVGTLGVCYIVKAGDRFYFKDGNILWFKQKGLCETRFIKEQYATDYVMNQIKGNANIVTVGTYTITNANKTKVIVPPLELQKQFVNRLEAIDRQKELVKQSIVETEMLFNSRMDFWFNN